MEKLKPLCYALTLLIIFSLTQERVRACSGSSKKADEIPKNEESNENSAGERNNEANGNNNQNRANNNNKRMGVSRSNCTYGDNQCNDGGCFTDAQKCDGTRNCGDGSDEDIHHCDHDDWPTFEPIWCNTLPEVDPKYTKCFKVQFPADTHADYMLLEKIEDAFKTYRGIMKHEPITVVYNEPDIDDDENMAGARFHSMHVAACTAFEIDLSLTPHTSACLKDHPKPKDIDDKNLNLEEFAMKNPAGISFRLNPKGYRVRTKVYYDNAMLAMYNRDENKVRQKLRSVMLYVEEMFHEKDTLTTIVQINAKTLKIEKAGYSNNWSRSMSKHLGSTLGRIAKKSNDEADLYVFMTGKGDGNPLGIAYVGTVCNRDRTRRVSINRYGIAGSQKNKVLYTAETIAHEMGHNLGMRHDFKRTDSKGNNCYGYMDYKDDTNYWSTCSVEDFMDTQKDCLKTANNRDDDYSDGNSNDNDSCNDDFLCKWMPQSACNRQQGKKSCPRKCNACNDSNTRGGDSDDSGCSDNVTYGEYCKEHNWACNDSRYPWFRENCKETCNACNEKVQSHEDRVHFVK